MNPSLRLMFLGAWALCMCAGGPLWAQYTLQETAQPGTVPGGVGYQGRLELNGVPVIGTKNMRFKLYNARTGGALLWPLDGDSDDGKRNVTFTQGIFGVSLDIPLRALVGSSRKFLEVMVEDVVLVPRDPLLSVPYAKVAQTVEGTIDISTGGLIIQNAGGVVLHVSSITARVGIGTTAPNATLSVSSSVPSGIASGLELANPNAAAGTGQRLVFNFDPGGNAYQHAALEAARTDGTGTTHLALYTRSSANPSWDPPTERMRVAGGGNVGIGTTDPSASLEVKAPDAGGVPGMVLSHSNNPRLQFQVAGSSMLVVEHDATAGRITTGNSTDLVLETEWTERLRVKSNGNVGIGTSDPQTSLHVAGAFRNTDVIETTAGGTVGGPAIVLGGAADADMNTGFYHPNDNQIGIVTAGAERVRIDASGQVAIGTDLNANGMRLRVTGGDVMVGGMVVPAEQTTLDPDLFVQGNLVIGGDTINIGASSFERLGVSTQTILDQLFKVGAGTLTVLESGRVGIGTTNPAFPLDIQAAVVPGLSLDHAANPQIMLRVGSTDRLALQYASSAGKIGTAAGAGDLVLATNDTERVRITAATNRVGIGTTDPQAPLHVNGSAQVDGSLTLTTKLSVANGGTSADTALGARNALDLADRYGLEVTPGTTWPINISGSVDVATRLAVAPTVCASGLFPKGVDQYGNAVDCLNPVDNVEGSVEQAIYDNDNALGSPWTVTSAASNIDFDAGTFFIDVTANKVGVGNTSPTAELTVQGSVNASGKLKQGGADIVPTGMVMFFNLGSCPAGWSEFTPAKGRYIVGRVASTGVVVGSAFTSDGESRATGQHSHSFTGTAVPDHTHAVSCTELSGHAHTFSGDPAGTHGHSINCSALPDHTHAFTGDTTGSDHTHGVNDPTHSHGIGGGQVVEGGNDYFPTGPGTTAWSAAAATGISITTTGSDHTHTGTVGSTIPNPSCSTTGGGDHTPTGTIGNASAGTPSCSTTGAGSHTPGGSISDYGSVAGTNAPYIQLIVCQKN